MPATTSVRDALPATRAKLHAVQAAVSAGQTLTAACQANNLSVSTWHKYMGTSPTGPQIAATGGELATPELISPGAHLLDDTTDPTTLQDPPDDTAEPVVEPERPARPWWEQHKDNTESRFLAHEGFDNVTTAHARGISILDTAMVGNVPILMWGNTGLGKTATIERWCEARGWPLVTMEMSNQFEESLVGTPMVSASTTLADYIAERYPGKQFDELTPEQQQVAQKHATTKPPMMRAIDPILVDLAHQCADNPDKICVLFLDEVNRGRRGVLNTLQGMTGDKPKLGGEPLPKNLRVIAAANRAEDIAGADFTPLDDTQRRRFVHLDWEDFELSDTDHSGPNKQDDDDKATRAFGYDNFSYTVPPFDHQAAEITATDAATAAWLRGTKKSFTAGGAWANSGTPVGAEHDKTDIERDRTKGRRNFAWATDDGYRNMHTLLAAPLRQGDMEAVQKVVYGSINRTRGEAYMRHITSLPRLDVNTFIANLGKHKVYDLKAGVGRYDTEPNGKSVPVPEDLQMAKHMVSQVMPGQKKTAALPMDHSQANAIVSSMTAYLTNGLTQDQGLPLNSPQRRITPQRFADVCYAIFNFDKFVDIPESQHTAVVGATVASAKRAITHGLYGRYGATDPVLKHKAIRALCAKYLEQHSTADTYRQQQAAADALRG